MCRAPVTRCVGPIHLGLVAVKGRHTSGDDRQHWAPNAKQAALAIAPMAALIIAVGAGGAGLLTRRADVATAGAAAGMAGVVLEQSKTRAARRRIRRDRTELRGQIRDLEATVAQLRRELDTAPSVLRPTPPPLPTTGPLPIVDAFDRASSPATPRSLPILTANRRGLQSCAPGLPGMPVPAVSATGVSPLGWPILPSQRPPATPITGLHMPPLEDPSLPKLTPGPAAPVLATAGVPKLTPGPSQQVAEHPDGARVAGHGRHAGLGRHAVTPPSAEPLHDLALIGAALAGDLANRPETSVVDLRAVPARRPMTATMPAAQVEAMVYASIADAAADDFVVTLEGSGGRSASLFEPVNRPAHDARAEQEDIRQVAAGARAASRAMRPRVPPSPFFTPGAFVGETRPEGARHSA